eukprot:g2394.t1
MSKEEIFNQAIDWGCCKNCASRFAGTFSEVREGEEENVCVVCLGSLSSSKELDGLVELFREKLEKYSEVKDFQLNVSMPRNCGIRAAMIRHELAKTFSRDYSSLSPSPDLKTCLKSVLVLRLERVLKLSHCSNSQMQLSLDISHETSDLETRLLFRQQTFKKKNQRKRKRGNNNTIGTRQIQAKLDKLDTSSMPKSMQTVPSRVKSKALSTVSVSRKSIYVYGRYQKFLRGLSQSPWFINGKRKGVSSVEEEITKVVLPHFGRVKKSVFQSGGREDIDVRMLGQGRPFLLELQDSTVAACSSKTCREMESQVLVSSHGAIGLRELRLLTSSEVSSVLSMMQEAALTKKKEYVAIVWTERPIEMSDLARVDAQKDFVLKQLTPIRVAHRRSMMIRDKKIHKLKCTWINSRWFELRITASAGTYIKEFVHGDLGRTTPNLSTFLGCKADIIQLDVANVII